LVEIVVGIRFRGEGTRDKVKKGRGGEREGREEMGDFFGGNGGEEVVGGTGIRIEGRRRGGGGGRKRDREQGKEEGRRWWEEEG